MNTTERANLIAVELNALTGLGFVVSPFHCTDCFVLSVTNQLTLFLNLYAGRYKAKGKGAASYARPFSASLGRIELYENGHNVRDPRIEFSLAKADAQIAKDLARRLLPEAARIHALVLARLEKENAYAEASKAAAATAERLGCPDGQVQFSGSGSLVEICGRVTPERAEKIHAFLSTLNG